MELKYNRQITDMVWCEKPECQLGTRLHLNRNANHIGVAILCHDYMQVPFKVTSSPVLTKDEGFLYNHNCVLNSQLKWFIYQGTI